ncbi:MAG TPA: sugar transferase [Acidimicrobiales bacterium]|nr:sugar transferase [Acidimicrobiales bacterium]
MSAERAPDADARTTASLVGEPSTNGHSAVAAPLLGLDLPAPPELAGFEADRQAPAITGKKLLVADSLALVVAGGLAVLADALLAAGPHRGLAEGIVLLLAFPVCQLLAIGLLGLPQRAGRHLQPSSFADLRALALALALGTSLAAGVVAWLVHILGWHGPRAGALGVEVGAALLATPTARSAAYHVWRSRRPTRILIVGSGVVAGRLRDYLSRDRGAMVVGFVDDDPAPPTHVIGRTRDLPVLCRRLQVDRVLVSFSRTHPGDLTEALRELHGMVPIAIVPRYFELLSWRSKMDDLCGLPIVDIAPPSLGRMDRFVKRTFDLVVSIAILLVLWPALVALAVAIKVSSPGPVLFRQDRVGRYGQVFRMYKFRSMRQDAEQVKDGLRDDNDVEGPLFKLRVDPRVTPIGRFLRKTSLDELPQLLNVIAGQMSLVGPRPFVPAESEQIDGWARKRFEARPGLTGLWQVSGRNDLSYDDLRRLDYLYVASWSLAWDIKILWQTPGSVFRGNGAY